MRFRHSDEIWRDFPALVPGVVFAGGITGDVCDDARTERFLAIARSRLAEMPEAEMPPIQAWRRAFSRMGVKPTQYRCASESLLRRFRKEGSIPRLHPLVDLCNAVSLAFAIPVAVFDVSAITGDLEVRYAVGDEDYVTFSGDVEHPPAGEVIFADAAGQAHARRWTNRQSGLSAMRDETAAALIVAEALHDSASAAGASVEICAIPQGTTVWPPARRSRLQRRRRGAAVHGRTHTCNGLLQQYAGQQLFWIACTSVLFAAEGTPEEEAVKGAVGERNEIINLGTDPDQEKLTGTVQEVVPNGDTIMGEIVDMYGKTYAFQLPADSGVEVMDYVRFDGVPGEGAAFNVVKA